MCAYDCIGINDLPCLFDVLLQYAHARMSSIFRKAEAERGVNIEELKRSGYVNVQHPSEVALASDITRFQV